MDYPGIIESVKEALSRRDSRRDVLAKRIREIVEPAFDAARVRGLHLGEAGKLEYRVPVATCAQGESWPHYEHLGEPVLTLVLGAKFTMRTVGPEPDISYHDGQNWQRQIGPSLDFETYSRLGGLEGVVSAQALDNVHLRPATVAQLRAVAAALPAALAALLEDARQLAESEAKEADEVAAQLGVTAVHVKLEIEQDHAIMHLLPTRGGGTLCNSEGASDADIEKVTCERCLELHVIAVTKAESTED